MKVKANYDLDQWYFLYFILMFVFPMGYFGSIMKALKCRSVIVLEMFW